MVCVPVCRQRQGWGREGELGEEAWCDVSMGSVMSIVHSNSARVVPLLSYRPYCDSGLAGNSILQY